MKIAPNLGHNLIIGRELTYFSFSNILIEFKRLIVNFPINIRLGLKVFLNHATLILYLCFDYFSL